MNAAGQVGILVVARGSFGTGLVEAVRHVMGEQEGLQAIVLEADDDIDERRREIRAAVDSLDSGAGVVIVTDMFGSTAGNLALSVREEGRVEVLAGANLPAMIGLAKARGEGAPLAESVSAARDAGRRYLDDAGRLREKDEA